MPPQTGRKTVHDKKANQVTFTDFCLQYGIVEAEVMPLFYHLMALRAPRDQKILKTTLAAVRRAK
jgi:hypothetical protein